MGSHQGGAKMTLDRKAPILSALDRLRVAPDQITELRALNVPRRYGKPATVAGYFDDMEKLAEAALHLEDRGAPGIYITLNPVSPALISRAYNRLDEFPKATTCDANVIRRVWLPFDFDPVRPAGISSTTEELDRAKDTALRAAEWLTTELEDEPAIWACSGNGYHLLFRIDLPNDDESTEHVRHIISVTADRFSNNSVSVDRSVFDLARIWKLYGTVARKGDEVPKLRRVHRRACVLSKGFDE